MALLVSGSVISPIDKRSYLSIPNALTYVTQDGVIRAIHDIKPHGADVKSEESEVEAFLKSVNHHGKLERLHLGKGEFLIPGFVDTHTVRALRVLLHTIGDRD